MSSDTPTRRWSGYSCRDGCMTTTPSMRCGSPGRARAAEQGLPAVHFTHGAIDAIALDEPVDAVVGRLILMHLPDPAATLRRLRTLVRPGGVIAFSENDITATSSTPDLPLFRQVTAGIARAFEA